jgi:hypothetical protein
MRERFLRLFFAAIFLSIYISAFSQTDNTNPKNSRTVIDSLKNSGIIFDDNRKSPEIVLSTSQAVKFLQQRVQPQFWNDVHNPFRQAVLQLIFEASHAPYDSAANILKTFPYDSLRIPWSKFYIWEPLKLKIPVITTADISILGDTIAQTDTLQGIAIIDSLKPRPIFTPESVSVFKPVSGLKDTTILVVIDTLNEVPSAHIGSPFRYFNYPFQGDSIEIAVRSLLKYLEERDSTIINFTGIGDVVTPVWMNSKSDRMMRYWLKNEFSDSVTIWIGTPNRNTFGLYLEQGVNFRRPLKQGNYSDAKINVQSIDKSKLLDVQKIYIKPQYWKYRTEAAFVLNQTALTNWVRGGENSISTAMDITGYADYNNKQLKVSSNNFARLKLGFLKSGSNPVRKNLDLLETNSKLNHKAFGKFDFSGILLFKTQIAEGNNYYKDINGKDSADLVSKFMNPAILIVGLGLDYKPNKVTSINLSPLSYKGTFVIDPANIDQTNYGIASNKRSKNEPGASFMITHEYKPLKSVVVTNRLQLFTNYIDHPANIDVDWEMIMVAKLNWFTDVRFNTHLIFDDDTKTVELRPDGTEKKTARIQFKEMLGFSLVFRF